MGKIKKSKEKAVHAAWYKKNSEKVKAKTTAWREKNKERKKATDAAWREKNKERKKATDVAWRKKNKERIKAVHAAWYKKNKERIKAKNAKRQRGLEHIELNDGFDGSEGHHIDKEFVVHIPAEMHRSVAHNVFTGKNMDEINDMAMDFVYGD